MKRKVKLFIAMSVDGFIAKDEDNIDFLSSVELQGEDYGYAQFLQSVDTLIWGRKTYDKVRTIGSEYLHRDKKVYVWSRSRVGKEEHVEFYNNPIDQLISKLQNEPGKDIYCDGGAEIIFELLKESLIDELTISVIPHLVGRGIRLFKDGAPEQSLIFKRSISYPTGLVQLCYAKKIQGTAGVDNNN